MLINSTKKYLFLVLLLASITNYLHSFSTNCYYGNDPYPMYSTLDPHEFMYRWHREWLKNLSEKDEQERIRFSVSPFAQFADRGRNIKNDEVYLGDINGRWNMIALLFGETPQGKTLPPSLSTAKDALFGVNAGVITNPETYVDPTQRFGFFAVPLKYRKYGVRFEADFRLVRDLGFCVQFGYACICQRLEDVCLQYDICRGVECVPNLCTYTCSEDPNTTCPPDTAAAAEENSPPCDTVCCPDCAHRNYRLPIDLTACSPCSQYPPPNLAPIGVTKISRENVQFYLMRQLHTIAKELGLDLCDFNKASIEDVRFNFYWRHALEVNEDKEGWEHFLLIPFLEACFVVGVGDARNTSCMFSLPFGNNCHNAVGFKGGFLLDFTETVELGFEAGLTHFFSKSFSCYRVPNSIHQSGIYPYTTAVRVCPGLNCHGSLKLATRHFLGRLSTFFQYLVVMHKDDTICPCKNDPAFQPCLLERKSCWKSHLANIGFNYDISENISLGVLWQAPLSQKRAYRSNTVMFSINMVY